MAKLCKRLIGLIGKPYGDPQFSDLAKDLNDPNSGEHKGGDELLLDFPKYGIIIQFMDGECCCIEFHLSTAMVQAGTLMPYTDELPYGIERIDSKEAVQAKLGLEPRRTKMPGPENGPGSYCDRYPYQKVLLDFSFDVVSGCMRLLCVEKIR